MATGTMLSRSEQDDIIAVVFAEGSPGLVQRYARPPITIKLISGGGSDRSFFRIEGGGVVLDTIKAAEDGGGLVLRLYDASGRGGAVTLTLPEAPLSVTETNLMEQPLKEMKAENKSVALDFDRFEIKTIRIRWP